MTTKLYISKCKKIHNNKFSYDKTVYTGCYDDVIITCPIHGDFSQKAYSHLQGIGCAKCHFEKLSDKLKYSLNDWLLKFKTKHGDIYDYSLITNIDSSKDYVNIKCKKHGIFKQQVIVHSQGSQCPLCVYEANKINNLKHQADVIKDFNIKHNNKYNYDKVIYTGAKEKITITCPKHGDFIQTPNDHLTGYGCPKCYVKTSKAEDEIINFLNYDLLQTTTHTDRTIIYPQELDILIPEKNVAIEYNGVFWHSFDRMESTDEIYYHYNKTKACASKGIMLIHIFEDEWMFKKDIIKSLLVSKLNLIKSTFFARKCKIQELSNEQFNGFCLQNHLQGKRNSKVKIGLFYNDELVCCMGFSKHYAYEWELTRFCNKLNVNVVGGASKLLKYFLLTYNPASILSFCDIRFSSGNLYEKLGFTYYGTTKPNYRYIKGLTSLSRYKCQKHNLNKLLSNYDSALSEPQNMFNNGYRRLWDCGNIKYILTT
jgi:hypothetical protein